MLGSLAWERVFQILDPTPLCVLLAVWPWSGHFPFSVWAVRGGQGDPTFTA